MSKLQFFPKVRAAIKETRDAIKAYKRGKRDDGVLDEEEAVEFIKESFEVLEIVFGEVKLSESAKSVVRALCFEMLGRLGERGVRAKLTCTSKQDREVSLFPDYGAEVNKEWAAATPAASVSMTIANPRALAFFDVGEDYFLDFSRAPKEG